MPLLFVCVCVHARMCVCVCVICSLTPFSGLPFQKRSWNKPSNRKNDTDARFCRAFVHFIVIKLWVSPRNQSDFCKLTWSFWVWSAISFLMIWPNFLIDTGMGLRSCKQVAQESAIVELTPHSRCCCEGSCGVLMLVIWLCAVKVTAKHSILLVSTTVFRTKSYATCRFSQMTWLSKLLDSHNHRQSLDHLARHLFLNKKSSFRSLFFSSILQVFVFIVSIRRIHVRMSFVFARRDVLTQTSNNWSMLKKLFNFI